MNDVLYPIVAAVAWLGAANQLRKLLRKPRPDVPTPQEHSPPATIGLVVAFTGLALTFTICIPAVFEAVDAAFGVANISILISQTCVLVYTGGQEIMLLYMTHSPDRAHLRTWRRIAILACIIPIMTFLFVISDADEQRTRDFVATYAGIKTYAVYLALYLAAFGLGQIDVLRMALTLAVRPICPDNPQHLVYVRIRKQASLRRGLRTVAAGSCLGLAYVAARTADIVVAALDLGFDPHRWEFVAQIGSGVGAMLVIIGLSIPSWTSGIAYMRAQLRLHRQYNILYDLWLLMTQTVPGVALHGPAGRLDRLSFRELRYRTQRRITEIRDALMILDPLTSDATAAQARKAAAAAGITGQAADAIAAAARWKAAAASFRAQKKTEPAPMTPDLKPVASTTGPGRGDPVSDAAWLAQVSQALRSSLIVNQPDLDTNT